MWIVYLADNTRHSAWITRGQARHQKHVLEEVGFKHVTFDFDFTTECENGHYYI